MDHFFRTAYVPGWVNELEKLDPEWVKDLEKGWVKDLEKLRLQMGDVSRKITFKGITVAKKVTIEFCEYHANKALHKCIRQKTSTGNRYFRSCSCIRAS
jgi:hypothetical protein